MTPLDEGTETTTPLDEGTGIGPARRDEARSTWLRAATGRIIRVQMLDGKKLIGQLLAFDHAALVIQGSAPTPLLVFTQSVAYLAVEEQAARPKVDTK